MTALACPIPLGTMYVWGSNTVIWRDAVFGRVGSLRGRLISEFVSRLRLSYISRVKF